MSLCTYPIPEVTTLLDLEGILLLSSLTSEQTEPIVNAISISSEAYQLAALVPPYFMLHAVFETWGSPHPDTLTSLNVSLSATTSTLSASPSITEELMQSAMRYLAWVLPQSPRQVATSSFSLCSAVLQHPTSRPTLTPLVLSALLPLLAQSAQSAQPAQPAPLDIPAEEATLQLACVVVDALPGDVADALYRRVWTALRRSSGNHTAYDVLCVAARRLGESGLGYEALAPTTWSAAELALEAAGSSSLPPSQLVALAQAALQHVSGVEEEVEAVCGLLSAVLLQVEPTSIQPVVAWRVTVRYGGAFHR